MALYRKYRPATFAEVVGQEQVTTPLSAALDAGRINHAYLFSGPRGCGKTSSARIMARSLNCEHGPTSTPCGKCDSCVSLAPGGPGNLDVTELDAASHNGVEDMRELRDRAYYAPAESRYRIFIIDEAHMISPSGANALLKVVEEPPEHVIFIFATTEPEKIIGTIRSRTHHYPFRLLTPPAMKGLLQRTVAAEGVHVEDAVYPMVIEAGGGSPRDTLSLLDQLLAGAGPDGLTYDLARPLLGVTDVSLLDDAIETLANQDKPGLFAMVDHVIEAGHDPRRFAVDLLDRLRDLMILQAVPGAIDAGLVSAPTDRASVLTAQAQRFSGPQLTYLASTVNDRISDLTGATSPRLLLEIMCAHLLIGSTGPVAAAPASAAAPAPAPAPAANAAAVSPAPAGPATPGGAPAANSAVAGAQDPQSAAAAIIARRRAKSQEQQASAPSPAPTSAPTAQPQAPSQPESQPDAQPQAQSEQPAAEAQSTQRPQGQEPQPQQQEAGDPWQRERQIPQAKVPEQQSAQSAQSEAPHSAPAQEKHREPLEKPVPARAEETAPEAAAQPAPEPAPQTQAAEEPDGDFAEAVREKWVALRGSVGKRNKVAEIMLAEARVLGFRDGTLTLGHTTGALAERINAPANNAVIVEVLKEEFQRDVAVNCVVGTDPKTAGFDAPRPPQRKEAWTPNQPAREPADDQEAESKTESAPGWRSRIARATQAAKQRDESQFSNGVPLPPEPEPDFAAPPEEPPAYTRDDEERDMMEAAQSTGEMDHRSATEVAMELLERELGARRA
ncbi:DNA polymerase III subunit gamma and tau [Corynebacterium marquesiae]|uniref:DNA polymerase III subunit gamma and tau n=1 Tax=Corynebacterium marquesiae TaxID=2913503 RepID=UPI002550138A|nr:DNA polymerase III subunit gamma and tau [Corynebacterium marquesiae]MDK8454778.1 DNA polymerase III subunit gamma and tau [Corynebacterium marquesiae]MDK8724897.1 DNA polymerase III subunit gamma and tau [Corynebacterium marquesiae]MDK8770218.1 DNA polymerase III subunit gamma and tau [Corynebacterium marquesiae]